MIRVLTIFGTRPEAIKLAPVIKSLEKCPERFRSVVCVTAQRRDMLDQVLSVFDIKPQYDLDIMKPGQSLTDAAAEILRKVREVLCVERPDVVLVQTALENTGRQWPKKSGGVLQPSSDGR
jgi:UDP-N-acetylglucosamine 2-epimerase (non-hydrolysing)